MLGGKAACSEARPQAATRHEAVAAVVAMRCGRVHRARMLSEDTRPIPTVEQVPEVTDHLTPPRLSHGL